MSEPPMTKWTYYNNWVLIFGWFAGCMALTWMISNSAVLGFFALILAVNCYIAWIWRDQ